MTGRSGAWWIGFFLLAPAVSAQSLEMEPLAPTPARIWVRGEALLWWVEGAKLPALLTASPPGTPQSAAGVLGTPGTRILFGQEDGNEDLRSGLRLTAGTWLDCEQTLGVQGSFFILEGQGEGARVGSADGNGQIGRPFLNALTGQQDAQLVNFPGLLGGTADALADSTNLLGADLLLRKQICCGCNYRVDALGGYRFLRFDDHVGVREDLLPLSAPFVPGTRLTVVDDFGAQNEFHGGTLGVLGTCQSGAWSLEIAGRVSLGEVNRQVTILGATTSAVPGQPPLTSPGGLLAQVTNIGVFREDDFTVIPELDLAASYALTDGIRLRVGYSLLIWPRVARAAEQIDPVVNRNLIPATGARSGGPARPLFQSDRSDMWVQGLSLGLEWHY